MKKLLVLFTVVVFASCSQDHAESSMPVSQETSLSVLDGDLLSYKDDASFIKEYSKLSELKSKEDLQNWISKKGHQALFNNLESSENYNDSINDNSRILYSDALKAIINADSKIQINGEVIWLNERILFKLTEKNLDKSSHELKFFKNDLKIYGKINSLPVFKEGKKINQINRYILPNENAKKTFSINGSNDKRYFLDLFNETIILNDDISSSKMFLRSAMQYKSCSFWRCTYKTDTSTSRRLELNLEIGGFGWNRSIGSNIVYLGGFQGAYTVLLATANVGVPYAYPGNFTISGNVMTVGFNGYVWNQTMSWY